jgi:gas vesicle protein
MGFIIGLLTGAIVALLYAPKTGDITREELKVRSEELKRRADELQKIAQKLADDASVKGRELIDEAKKQWDSSGVGRASTGASASGRSTPGGSTKAD